MVPELFEEMQIRIFQAFDLFSSAPKKAGYAILEKKIGLRRQKDEDL